jgi:hypothetical protein
LIEEDEAHALSTVTFDAETGTLTLEAQLALSLSMDNSVETVHSRVEEIPNGRRRPERIDTKLQSPRNVGLETKCCAMAETLHDTITAINPELTH